MAQGICSIEGCDKPVFHKAMCATHYHRQRTLEKNGGSLPLCQGCGKPYVRTRQTRLYCKPECRPRCSVAECDQEAKAKGMCDRHYQLDKYLKTGRRVRKPGNEKPRVLIPCPSEAAYRRGCRCDGCRDAAISRDRERRATRVPRDDMPHGLGRYTWPGCRCEICRAANAEHQRAYLKRNPEKRRIYNAQTRASRAGAPFDATAREYAALIARDPCSYFCGHVGATVDHIIPIKAGGTSEWENLTAACRSCNPSKGDRSLLVHLLTICRQADATRGAQLP